MLIIACIPVLTLYGLWSYYTYKGLIINTIEHEGDPGQINWVDSGSAGPESGNNTNNNYHADRNHSSNEFSDSDCIHDSSAYHIEPIIRNPMYIDHNGSHNGKKDMTRKKNEDVMEIYLSNFHHKANDTDEDMEEGKMEYVRTDDKHSKRYSDRNGEHKNDLYEGRNGYFTTASHSINIQNIGQKGPSQGLNSPSQGLKGPSQGLNSPSQGQGQGQGRDLYQMIDEVSRTTQSLSRESSTSDYSKNYEGVAGRGRGRGRGLGIVGGITSSKLDSQVQVGQKNHNGHNNNDIEYNENPLSASFLSAPLLESDYYDKNITHIEPNLNMKVNSDLKVNTAKLKKTELENSDEFEVMEL